MARKLRVYMSTFGYFEAIVAAHNQREAAQLLGTSYNDFRNYGHETFNAEQVALAMQEPGVVWRRELRSGNVPWKRTGQEDAR